MPERQYPSLKDMAARMRPSDQEKSEMIKQFLANQDDWPEPPTLSRQERFKVAVADVLYRVRTAWHVLRHGYVKDDF